MMMPKFLHVFFTASKIARLEGSQSQRKRLHDESHNFSHNVFEATSTLLRCSVGIAPISLVNWSCKYRTVSLSPSTLDANPKSNVMLLDHVWKPQWRAGIRTLQAGKRELEPLAAVLSLQKWHFLVMVGLRFWGKMV